MGKEQERILQTGEGVNVPVTTETNGESWSRYFFLLWYLISSKTSLISNNIHPFLGQGQGSQGQAGQGSQGQGNGGNTNNPHVSGEIPANERAREVSRRFKERTHLPRKAVARKERGESFRDDRGRTFRSQNIDIRTKANRVHLRGDRAEIKEVHCTREDKENGTLAQATLTLVEAIDSSLLEDVFPHGAVVMIMGADFGHCELGVYNTFVSQKKTRHTPKLQCMFGLSPDLIYSFASFH